MERSQKKRLVIVGVYLAIFLLVVFGIYYWLKPGPSCFDNIQNQNEEGLDCGGVCAKKCDLAAQQDIAVLGAGFVNSGVANNIDIFGEVSNPNQTLGSGNFEYQFIVKNSADTAIANYSGTGFILPGEKKYILMPNISVQDIPAKVDLKIGKTQWTEANEFYEKPQLNVVYKNYTEISSGVGFFEATGLVKNESPFDFSNIKIAVILRDANEKIVTLNSTEMNTVIAGENRDFRVYWPNRFSGDVANMEVQAEVNIFNSEAFVKKNFKPQQFQQY